MPQFLPYNTLAEGDEFRDADGNVVETFNPDVTTNAPVADNILVYNGTEWVPMAAGGGGGGNPIGSIIQSILTQAQIDTQESGTWQLCDGAATTAGSALLALGFANVPDAQGRVLAGAGVAGSAASKTLNTQLDTQNLTHAHQQMGTSFTGAAEALSGSTGLGIPVAFGGNTSSNGGDEARPFTYVVNHFIKIN